MLAYQLNINDVYGGHLQRPGESEAFLRNTGGTQIP